MPTYIQKTDNSDLAPSWPNTTAFDKVLSTGTGTDSTVTVSLTSSQTKSGGFITPAGVPNSDQWEDGGTWTVELEVTTGNHQITGNCRVIRLDSSGNIIQSGALIGTQNLDTTRTFSPVAPTWEAEEACGNRLAIEVVFVEGQNMANSVTLGNGTVLSEVVTDVVENAGGCAAAAVPAMAFGNRGAAFNGGLTLQGRTLK